MPFCPSNLVHLRGWVQFATDQEKVETIQGAASGLRVTDYSFLRTIVKKKLAAIVYSFLEEKKCGGFMVGMLGS